MCCRRYAFLAAAFLVLAAFSALPAAAADQPATSCGLMPWEQAAAAPVTPVVDDQPPAPFFTTSCTTSSQCPPGNQCHCGQCHLTCPSPQRWNCLCQTCYLCGPGMYFDSGSCSCEYI